MKKCKLNLNNVATMVASLAVSMMIWSCNDKPSGIIGGDDSGNDPSGFEITAKVVNGNDYNDIISTVVFCEHYDYTTGSVDKGETKYTGQYSKGGFTVTLGKPKQKDFRKFEDDYYGFFGVGDVSTINDDKAKCAICWSYLAYDKDGKYLGYFRYIDNYDYEILGSRFSVYYVYSDRNVTIKGASSYYVYDIDMKEGWNILYHQTAKKFPCLRTTKTVGGMKWYFYPIEDDNDNDDDDEHEDFTINEVNLGSQSNTTDGSFYSVGLGDVFLSSKAKEQCANIDFVYFYSSTNNGTIAAPADPNAQATFTSISSWSVKNETKFYKNDDVSIYMYDGNIYINGVRDDNGIELAKWWDRNIDKAATDGTTKVDNLTYNDVVVFKTDGGVKGAFYIDGAWSNGIRIYVIEKGIIEATGVTLNKTELNLLVNNKETLTATVLPKNVSKKTAKWSSSNTAVATVDAATGEVTAKSIGTATITATAGVQTATCAVTVSSLEPEMVSVGNGTFVMGEAGIATPVHDVTLSGFKIGKYEITQAQWTAVMGDNPSSSSSKSDKNPVNNVSWVDIVGSTGATMEINGISYRENGYIYKLNTITGKKYRLPTEAEWEYAARGGNSTNNYTYSGSNTISEVAWFDSTSEYKCHPVGGKDANELGIYDMTGNVWEWCSDWYGDYSSSPQNNPTGPTSGNSRVVRGGGYDSGSNESRVAYRLYLNPASRRDPTGFRVAQQAE